jgi:eukaryotic-like serine/threonine-protein kinase
MRSFPVDTARGATLPGTDMISVTAEVAVPAAQTLLTWLLDSLIVLPEEWDELTAHDREELCTITLPETLLSRLVHRHLLTSYQADAIRTGSGEDLILGHYRLLDLLGQGGMGTVYRAEHIQLRRMVALKVMARAVEGNPRLLHRFYGEARAVARLQHLLPRRGPGRALGTVGASARLLRDGVHPGPGFV